MTTERTMIVQPKELELLKRLSGEWDLEITARMSDGSRVDGKGVVAAEEIARGNGVHTRMSYDVGQGPIEEEDLWSFDRGGGKVHVFSVTSDHNVHDHTGDWRDDYTLEVRWQGDLEGKDTLEVMTVTWESPDRVRFKDTMSEGGRVTVESDFIATRRK